MPVKSDNELLTLLQQDDVQAFKDIYDAYWHKLFGIAVQKLPSAEDARDVLQELFLYVWKARHTLKVNTSLDGYLFIALKNRIFNFYHKQATAQKHSTRIVQMHRQQPLQNDAEAQLTAREINDAVQAELEQMPERMRHIYKLSRNGNLPSADIAHNLGLSDQTVRNQISSALKRLRQRLQPYTNESF